MPQPRPIFRAAVLAILDGSSQQQRIMDAIMSDPEARNAYLRDGEVIINLRTGEIVDPATITEQGGDHGEE